MEGATAANALEFPLQIWPKLFQYIHSKFKQYGHSGVVPRTAAKHCHARKRTLLAPWSLHRHARPPASCCAIIPGAPMLRSRVRVGDRGCSTDSALRIKICPVTSPLIRPSLSAERRTMEMPSCPLTIRAQRSAIKATCPISRQRLPRLSNASRSI